MKPTIRPGETWKTRDGARARVYATDGFGIYSIHGAVFEFETEEAHGGWSPESWTQDGHYDSKRNTGYDLVDLAEPAPGACL